MPNQTPDLLYDEKVLPAVIELIEKAKRQVVLVSPYNDFSTPLKGAVTAACKRPAMRVIVIGRKDQAEKENGHFAAIADAGAEVYFVERLHSKIYLNESTAILTSMNLSQGSAVNSREVALRFTDASILDDLVAYIRDRLLADASPFSTEASREMSWEAWTKGVKTVKEPNRAVRRPSGAAAARRQRVAGTCIRCEKTIPFDPSHPLCDADYKTWSRYSDADFGEKYCHRCGKKRNTTYAKPLCLSCYREVNA